MILFLLVSRVTHFWLSICSLSVEWNGPTFCHTYTNNQMKMGLRFEFEHDSCDLLCLIHTIQRCVCPFLFIRRKPHACSSSTFLDLILFHPIHLDIIWHTLLHEFEIDHPLSYKNHENLFNATHRTIISIYTLLNVCLGLKNTISMDTHIDDHFYGNFPMFSQFIVVLSERASEQTYRFTLRACHLQWLYILYYMTNICLWMRSCVYVDGVCLFEVYSFGGNKLRGLEFSAEFSMESEFGSLVIRRYVKNSFIIQMGYTRLVERKYYSYFICIWNKIENK